MSKNAIAVRKTTAVANWEKQMATDAQKAVEQEKSVAVGQFMSIRGGVMQFQGTPVPGNKLQGVVLSAILENSYYEGEFDPDNPMPPVCYAFGTNDTEMKPHEDAEKKQSDTCASCKWNKFGTAEKGKGKACKNGRRMAIMHVDSLKGSLQDAQIAFLKIPPTSLPGWAQYVKQLANMTGRPPYAVVTEIGLVPDPRAQFKVTFNLVKPIADKKLLAAVFAKHTEMDDAIAFPYQPADTSMPKKTGKKAAPARAAASAPRRKF